MIAESTEQSPERVSEENLSWLAAKALIAALAMRVLFNLYSRTKWSIPLWDVGLDPLPQRLTEFFGVTCCLWMFWRPLHKSFFLILFALVSFSWELNYSASAAFMPHVSLLCLLVLFVDSLPLFLKKTATSLFMCGLFLSASCFKLNEAYLHGLEFSPTGDFFHFYYQHPFLSNLGKNLSFQEFLPGLSIATEFFLAGLFIFNARLAADVSLIFCLALSVVHPPVLFVYFCFLPALFVLDENFISCSPVIFGRKIFCLPLFWCCTLLFSRPTWLFHSHILIFFCVILILIGFHISRMNAKVFSDFNLKFLSSVRQDLRVFAPLLLILLSVSIKLGFGLSPLGYSMFSASRLRAPAHQMILTDLDTCQLLKNNLKISVVTDAAFTIKNSSCTLTFPTRSGIDFVKKKICDSNIGVVWDYLKPGSEIRSHETCMIADLR